MYSLQRSIKSRNLHDEHECSSVRSSISDTSHVESPDIQSAGHVLVGVTAEAGGDIAHRPHDVGEDECASDHAYTGQNAFALRVGRLADENSISQAQCGQL